MKYENLNFLFHIFIITDHGTEVKHHSFFVNEVFHPTIRHSTSGWCFYLEQTVAEWNQGNTLEL